ncbi:ABC transporter permease [Algoriphagus sp. D3-2-R+10]|uniref:ABC transporter permease n=1 Tax=Algoriphagus aurantiacus TaxID=3103948 RepID=UPI002B3FBCBE|nr:ABC transporter permease [Algoriphagus sp. D3-2-R+10]MEB2775057.1 ABC transporter permease [Algoriphagus sp. D3-2-R+10]
MLRHNFLLFYRNCKRFKSTFIINLIGLSSGLACSLLIFLWVNDELQVDKFHEKKGELYQILENVEQGGETITRQSTSGPMAEAIAREMPEVIYAVTTSTNRIEDFILSLETNDIKARGLFADADFFKMFSFEVIQGDQNQVLNDKNSIVISETLAHQLFGSTDNVIGKMVEWQQLKQYQVTGVFRDISPRSSLQFDFVSTFESFKDDFPGMANWSNSGPSTFLLLQENTDIAQFNEKIADYVKVKTNGQSDHRAPFATKFSDTYLYNQYENGVQAGGRIEYVKLFSLIALFILFIACINFMNLSTARASGRIKELGVKKAIGAQRGTLVLQYLGESTLMALISLGVAILLVTLLLPQFNVITEKQLTLNFNLGFVLTLLSVVLVTGLIAGSYPALYISGLNSIAVLKGGKLNSHIGEVWARKGLVVFQFALSVILIVSVFVVYQQIEFVQKQHLGYEKENIVSFGREGLLSDVSKLETFISEVKKIPGVVGASNIGHNMAGHMSGTWGVEWTGKDPEDKTEFENVGVNYDVLELLNIQLEEGRTFSRDFGADSSKIIFNEAAIDFMGLTDPIGKKIKLWGDDREIIGVVKNFHFESFHEEVKPLFFRLSQNGAWNIMVKIEAGEEQNTLSLLQEFYGEFNPGFSLDYRFLDEAYQAQYVAEQRVSILSKYFAGLAILISCLGLFGLATYTAERRAKEIGIRKVLGSNEWKILTLLTRDFAKMVLISVVVAIPISYYLTKSWLDGFAFKIDLEWWFFIGAGALTMLIALLTVSFQSIKAALMNPVKSLKSE